MSESEKIKNIVRDKYGEIAKKAAEAEDCSCSCCCSSGDLDYSVFNDDYGCVEGYVPGADLKLGCGLPTQYAGIKPGDTVLDLGSGAGNDVFVARSIAGDTGLVIGVDMTREMIDQAEMNRKKTGFSNVEFRLGDIEDLPVDDNSVDVVVSNCVLNLVPDKEKAFSEIFRVLRPGAHFCVSDVVLNGRLPEKLRESAEMYAGCVAGASQQEDYLQIVRSAGFEDIEIKTSKVIDIPDSALEAQLSRKEIESYRQSGTDIISITLVGTKR